MTDIRAFLTARWDEQQIQALDRLEDGPSRTIYKLGGGTEQVREGVAYWRYVLDDLAAKRAILDQHAGANGLCGRCVERWDYHHDGCEECVDEPHETPVMYFGRPCPTVLLLAAPFASRPDFDPAWRMKP